MAGGADVNLGIDIEKKGQGDKEAAAGLELVAKAADDAADELKQLDRKLLETRAAMFAAGKQFAQTGDISPFKALLKDQRELQQVSKTLTKFSNDAAKALAPQMQATGLQAGEVFAGGFREALVSFAGPIGLVVGPPLVAAIGASIGAATLGGLGLGAIAAGIALQFKSPLVHDAATGLGDLVKDELTKATSGFGLQFAEGITALKREAEPLFADIRQGLTSLEPYVANLLARLGEGLAKLGPGLGRALEAAGPVLGAISKNIPTLLNGINIFFDEISKGGKGAAEAIDAILKTVSALIAGLGFAIRYLSNAFDIMLQSMDKITGVLSKIPVIGKEWETLHNYVHGVATSFDETKLSAGGASAAVDGMAGSSARATAALQAQQAAAQALRNQIDGLISASLGLAGANLQLRSDEAGLVDLHKQNGAALQGNTAQALANQQAFLGLARDLEATRQAEIAHGVSLQEADAQMQANAANLYAMAKAAGFDEGQVRALISSMLAIPDVHRTIQIDEIRTHTDIYRTIDQSGNITGGSPYQRSASQIGFALGGIVAAAQGLITSSPTILFGERGTGMEAYIPQRGISDRRGLALADTAARWHGGRVVSAKSPQNVTFNIYGATDPRAVADAVDDRLRQLGRDADFLARTRG